MYTLKEWLKRLIPGSLLLSYHKILALFAALWYGWPSQRLLVIGVTGTKGKSTTSNFIWSVLQTSGMKTGVLSTAVIRVGEQEFSNPYKMTMPGRFQVQKWLHRMLREGCKAVVLETTSQGIDQFRHVGVNYDVAVLTNLFPEHIEAHGSFENYVAAKEKLFAHLMARPHKMLGGKKMLKSMVVNVDVEQAEQFLRHPADRKVRFARVTEADITLADIAGWNVPLPGEHNLENVLAAVGLAQVLGLSLQQAQTGIEAVSSVPGRMEEFTSPAGFTVVVDYAHEPVSIELLYQTYHERLQTQGSGRLICVTGSAGGGRDTSRRPKLGALAAQYCDQVVVTNEDPYEEDPNQIIQQVAEGAKQGGKEMNIDLHVLTDRREGIATAISLAQPGDIVLCSGKGSEQAIVGKGGKKIPWDERSVVKELLHLV